MPFDIIPLVSRKPMIDGKSAYDWFIEGNNLDGNPKTYNDAISAYRKALHIDNKFKSAYINLGCVLTAKGDWYPAIRAFNRALEIDERCFKGYYNLGYVYYKMDCLEKAEHYFARAVAISPDDQEANLNLSIIRKTRLKV